MKAVILAAGMGMRLKSITDAKPKCLVIVGGSPILGHQIGAYANAGVRDLVVVAGYRAGEVIAYCQKFKNVNIKVIENKEYESTNNMYSLFLTREEVMGKEFLLGNGDVVFDPQIVYELVHGDIGDAIVCDKGASNEKHMKLAVGANGYVTGIDMGIPHELAINSVSIFRFSASSSTLFFEEMSRIIHRELDSKKWFEAALQRLVNDGQLRLRPFDVKGKGWVEVDDQEDLILARKLFGRAKNTKDEGGTRRNAKDFS